MEGGRWEHAVSEFTVPPSQEYEHMSVQTSTLLCRELVEYCRLNIVTKIAVKVPYHQRSKQE
eukprot:5362635-Amphidinium_carterae.2